MSAFRRFLTTAALLSAAAATLASCSGGKGPGGMPTSSRPPDLSRPSDAATGRRLGMLGGNRALCLSLLQGVGVRHTPLPPVSQGSCGYADGVRLDPRSPSILWAPAGLSVSCPVAAGLYLWERDVVQPAAQAQFGSRVVSIDHYGSYACRRINNGASGNLSEHARANAVDIAGFRLANGVRISVARDWNGERRAAAFLREVRDGACRLFGTTLSPDYNAAHADHLHLDQAARTWGRYCR